MQSRLGHQTHAPSIPQTEIRKTSKYATYIELIWIIYCVNPVFHSFPSKLMIIVQRFYHRGGPSFRRVGQILQKLTLSGPKVIRKIFSWFSSLTKKYVCDPRQLHLKTKLRYFMASRTTKILLADRRLSTPALSNVGTRPQDQTEWSSQQDDPLRSTSPTLETHYKSCFVNKNQ